MATLSHRVVRDPGQRRRQVDVTEAALPQSRRTERDLRGGHAVHPEVVDRQVPVQARVFGQIPVQRVQNRW
ncbi:hypothetical protein MMON_06870 [Mycolicibacterium monacense]|uniref:Uncharacterized protein n=1 Tax=Mycolicibacterium monacense TaxID=85693 RepID=A0AAD1IVS3_MYCMB|nr:hypothetical protein MMON_06870 [Mycolicibacterium monacense]